MSSEPEKPNRPRTSEQTASLGDKLAHGASEATGQAVEHIQHTRERLDTEFSRRRSRLTERIRDVRDVIESAGKKLGDEDMLADGLNFVSGRVDRLASYVESADPSGVAADLRELARERPAWFFGGTFLLGLALGRFAHSTGSTTVGASGAGARRPTDTPSHARTNSISTREGAEASRPQRSAVASRPAASSTRPATGQGRGADEP